jgi:arginine/serine-rich splicing factor 16
VSEAELAQEAEDDRVDEMAEGFGLEDFSYRLHKSLEKEGEDEARMRKPPR